MSIQHAQLLRLYLSRMSCTIVCFLLLLKSWSAYQSDMQPQQFVSIEPRPTFVGRIVCFFGPIRVQMGIHTSAKNHFLADELRFRLKQTKEVWNRCELLQVCGCVNFSSFSCISSFKAPEPSNAKIQLVCYALRWISDLSRVYPGLCLMTAGGRRLLLKDKWHRLCMDGWTIHHSEKSV